MEERNRGEDGGDRVRAGDLHTRIHHQGVAIPSLNHVFPFCMYFVIFLGQFLGAGLQRQGSEPGDLQGQGSPRR